MKITEEILSQLLIDLDEVRRFKLEMGLMDCIDNTGNPYQSQWCSDLIYTLRQKYQPSWFGPVPNAQDKLRRAALMKPEISIGCEVLLEGATPSPDDHWHAEFRGWLGDFACVYNPKSGKIQIPASKVLGYDALHDFDKPNSKH
ncbi:MAG: hypothetical protein AABY22_33705 [Nanoarchaeota archaeon]|mgnify:FL=1